MNCQQSTSEERSYQRRSDESDYDFQILTVNIGGVSSGQEDWIITAHLAKRAAHVKIDTGAQVNLLPYSMFRKISRGTEPSPCKTLLTSHGGGIIQHFGTITLPLQVGENKEPVIVLRHEERQDSLIRTARLRAKD